MLLKTKSSLIFIFLLIAQASLAQESMMQDVSFQYLEKLIAVAKKNYPKVRTYDSRVEIGRLNVKKARFDWFNIFTIAYIYNLGDQTTYILNSNTTPTTGNQTNTNFLKGGQIGVNTNIASIFSKGPAVKVAREELKIANADKEEYSLNIEAAVKQRYYIYIQQKSILKLKDNGVIDAENSLKEMKYKFEKGEETFENYNKAVAFYNSSVQLKIESEGSVLIARSNLEEIVGQKLDDIK